MVRALEDDYPLTQTCPNCGGTMVGQEKRRETVGQYLATAHWVRCLSCRHAGLRSWSYERIEREAARARDHGSLRGALVAAGPA